MVPPMATSQNHQNQPGIVKSEHQTEAARVFEGTGIQLTERGKDCTHKAGQRHLGAAVGSAKCVAAYLDKRVALWAEEVNRLLEVASTHPHAAYAGYVFGLRHRWTFLQLTMPNAGDHMQPLKEVIDGLLIPALTKHLLNDAEMDLVRLPA